MLKIFAIVVFTGSLFFGWPGTSRAEIFQTKAECFKHVSLAYPKNLSGMQPKFQDAYHDAILSMLKDCMQGKNVDTKFLPISANRRALEC
ncbi:hypothetical protein ACVINZ_004542 [Mesorhizobium jarvisii]